MNGLGVSVVGSNKLVELEKIRTEKARQEELGGGEVKFETGITAHIRKVWENNRIYRKDINLRLLKCLRARKGEYSADELSAIRAVGGADPVYLKLTGTKSRAAASWIRDLVLPIKGKNFGLNSTTIPELPEEIEMAVAQSIASQMQQMTMQNVQLSPEEQLKFGQMVREKVLTSIKALSDKAVLNVENKIQDLMDEGGWRKAIEEFVEDFVTFPYAVLKGPYYQNKRVLDWKKGKATPVTEAILCWRRVSVFDFYPSPYSRSPQELDFIERLRLDRASLYNMIGMQDYKDDEIKEVLASHGYGQLNDWLWENYERDQLEASSSFFTSNKDTIDALHYWGDVQGTDLLEWGVQVPDPLKMYPVDAILIGKSVIKVSINKNPMGFRPYHVASWDAVPGSMVGIALPEQMEDHQKIVNATTRSLVTNLSIASGPQAVVLTDMMADGEEITSIYPHKVWQAKSSITGNSGDPVKFFQPSSNADTLLGVLNTFEQKADDVTNVPRYSYGNEKIGGAGSTATGLSMLMSSAAKGIRRAISNIDLNIIQPTVYQSFIELMTNDPDPGFYGDVKVVPKGATAILVKEQLQSSQKEFLQITANPMDMEILGFNGRARLLRNIADELGLDPLMLPTEEDLAARDQAKRAQEEQQRQAEIAATQAQAQPQVEGGIPPEQQVVMEQQAAGLEQAQIEIQAGTKALQMKASELEKEDKRQKQIQQAIEQGMANLAAENIQLDLNRAKASAEIEKAKLELETKAAELQAAAKKIKLLTASKEEEVEKEGTDKEKAEAKVVKGSNDSLIKETLEQVAAVLKSTNSSKNISINRDDKGKIVGAAITSVK